MEDHVIIIIITVLILAAIFALHLLFNRRAKKLVIALDDMQAIHKFVEFLFMNEKKNIFLDLTLPPDLLEEFNKDKTISFSCVFNTGSMIGGYHIIFVLNVNQPGVLQEQNHIIGKFTPVHQQGEITGWYRIELRAC